MALIVQKYGGSSVGDADKIKHVARRIIDTQAEGNQVCVVVSAMGDTTDELLDLANQVAVNPEGRELDMLLTAGERISMALLAMAINELGAKSLSFTGSQAGIMTDEVHGNARIAEVNPDRVAEALDAGNITIVAGFQGFISPESFSLMESVMIVAMVVLGGLGHLPGVVLGAVLLSALPEILRYVAGPLQSMTDGRIDAAILRQLLIALAMIVIMLMRPRGLWPSREHGKSLQAKEGA